MTEYLENIENTARAMNAMNAQLRVGLVGTDELARLVTDSYFAGQHLLVEGVPGVGKTETAKKMPYIIGGMVLGRMQGTPDKQPADIIGFEFYNMKTGEFEPRTGSINSDVVVADELNMLSPKAQSAFLEALTERTLTIGNNQIDLPEDFWVVATQNPAGQGEGRSGIIKPLLDRFGASIYIGSPSLEDRIAVGRAKATGQHTAKPQLIIPDVKKMQLYKKIINGIPFEDKAIVRIATVLDTLSKNSKVTMKADGHRSMIAAIDVARSAAVREGKAQVTAADVVNILPYIVLHRMEVDADPSVQQAEKQELVADTIKKVA